MFARKAAQIFHEARVAQHVGFERRGVVRRRFVESGVAGLAERRKAGRKDHAVAPDTIELIVQTTLSPPPPGRTRWTTSLLGRKFDLTSATISRILRTNGLKPHLIRTYKVSRDPNFTATVKDVVGLYLNPPENAIVVSVYEKPSKRWKERSCRFLYTRGAAPATRTTTSAMGCSICTRR